jgi:hypothetical protein
MKKSLFFVKFYTFLHAIVLILRKINSFSSFLYMKKTSFLHAIVQILRLLKFQKIKYQKNHEKKSSPKIATARGWGYLHKKLLIFFHFIFCTKFNVTKDLSLLTLKSKKK